jgi:hypothetical protein
MAWWIFRYVVSFILVFLLVIQTYQLNSPSSNLAILLLSSRYLQQEITLNLEQLFRQDNNKQQTRNRFGTMTISVCSHCLAIGMAYTLAYREVYDNISVTFVESFQEVFGLMMTSTNEEKAEWINSWLRWMDEATGHYDNTVFYSDIKNVLEICNLELVYNVDTDMVENRL